MWILGVDSSCLTLEDPDVWRLCTPHPTPQVVNVCLLMLKRTCRSVCKRPEFKCFKSCVTFIRSLDLSVPSFNIKVRLYFLRVIMGMKTQRLNELLGGEGLAHSRCSAGNTKGVTSSTLLPTGVTDTRLPARGSLSKVYPGSLPLPHSLRSP